MMMTGIGTPSSHSKIPRPMGCLLFCPVWNNQLSAVRFHAVAGRWRRAKQQFCHSQPQAGGELAPRPDFVGLFSRPKAESTAMLLRDYRSVATKVSFGVICVVRALPLMSASRPKRSTATTTSDF